MLARRAQPVVEGHFGGPAVGFAMGTGFELDEGRRLLCAGREDAARAVVFEAARDEAHAVGEQCRGQRIAGMALIATPVKPEVEEPAAVDEAADLEAERLEQRLDHGPRLRAGGASPIL